MLCLCHYGPALLRFWFQTDLGRENSASYLKIQAGKTFLTMVTLYVQFLFSVCSKLDRWVHEENLCNILNLVYFDSWSWQSFMSTCDVLNCLFPMDVQNEIQLLSRVFCYSWLVCYWVLVVKCVACQSRKSERVLKSQAILASLDSFQELRLEL